MNQTSGVQSENCISNDAADLQLEHSMPKNTPINIESTVLTNGIEKSSNAKIAGVSGIAYLIVWCLLCMLQLVTNLEYPNIPFGEYVLAVKVNQSIVVYSSVFRR